MITSMMLFPAPKSEVGPGDNIFEWTKEDQDVIQFRYTRHHMPREDDFAVFVADALVGDCIDSDVIWRAVVSCNTLRENPGMRLSWLIEECERRHSLGCTLKKD